jgi:hypothetical protein
MGYDEPKSSVRKYPQSASQSLAGYRIFFYPGNYLLALEIRFMPDTSLFLE